MARRSERSAAAAAALAAAASASEAAAAAAAEPEPVFCLCRQPDDGIRPMIACEGGCEDWWAPPALAASAGDAESLTTDGGRARLDRFHATTCVPGLSDDNYEQIGTPLRPVVCCCHPDVRLIARSHPDDFICPNCEASTGRKTTCASSLSSRRLFIYLFWRPQLAGGATLVKGCRRAAISLAGRSQAATARDITDLLSLLCTPLIIQGLKMACLLRQAVTQPPLCSIRR